jgi:hypothetical protein
MIALLEGVNNNAVQISALAISAIRKPTNTQCVLALLQGQLDGRGQQRALVRGPLGDLVHLLVISVDDDSAEATKLPCTTDAIRLTVR